MNMSKKVRQMVQLAILTAIIFVLTVTPLGFLPIGPISPTTMHIPVLIGAILLGPTAGAILGGLFGLSAIIKVLIISPGVDLFATIALANAPARYIVVCLGARILMGWLAGVLSRVLAKIPTLTEKRGILSYGIVGFVGSFLNTIFYLGGLWLLCSQVVAEVYGVDISAVGGIVVGTAWAAGIPEAIVSCIIVSVVCKTLSHFLLEKR